MAVVDVQLYIARAKDFFSAMQLMRDDELYENSTALLAIHSAISYADALRNGLGQMSQQAEDHTKAVNSLLSLLRDRGFGDEAGLTHLKYLLSQKTAISYSNRRLDRREVSQLTAQG